MTDSEKIQLARNNKGIPTSEIEQDILEGRQLSTPKRKGERREMKKTKIVVSIEELEQASLGSLWELCPICGQPGNNNVCREHGEWKKGYVYFSTPQDSTEEVPQK